LINAVHNRVESRNTTDFIFDTKRLAWRAA
jgi:hypothetical protein